MFSSGAISYADATNQTVIARVPESGGAALPKGAEVIVQQNQTAVLFFDGRSCDLLLPGRHSLKAGSLPMIERLAGNLYERSDVQVSIYFVGMQTFLDQRWGTRQPITVRDPDFGIVRLRGFGKYSFRVIDAPLLINTLVGTQGKLTTSELIDTLRDDIVSGMNETLATAEIPLLDMPAQLNKLGTLARVRLADQFQGYGLELTQLVINSISPPEEVQRAIDQRSGMSILDTVGRFSQSRSSAAQPSPPQTTPSPTIVSLPAQSIGSILDDLSKRHGYTVEVSDGIYCLTVPISSLRQQLVYIQQNNDGNGQTNTTLRVWSNCGNVQPAQALQLLRSNNRLVYGAFALVENPGSSDLLTIQANVLSQSIESAELTRMIHAIAFQADQYEQQLSSEASDRY
jgi:membrane protease subunit (stomatin/prohibitin family)